MLNAIVAGTVPVYFGHSDTVATVFNPKRFIHCKFDVEKLKREGAHLSHENEARIEFVKKNSDTLEGLKTCIERIKRVDQDDKLWREIVSHPMLPNNQIEGTHWDLRPMARALRDAIDLLEPTWL
uniref:Uncharacterized protein n=1 Tax=Lotharella oceanica TaxID=641309 RepID=A0A7S2U0I7_9EUKA